MKRSYRIVLAVIMMLLMVFSSASMAFAAGATQGQKKTPEASIETPEIPGGEMGEASDLTSDEFQAILDASEETRGLNDPLTVHRMWNYSDISATPDATLKTQNRSGSYYVGQSSEVRINKGTLFLRGEPDDDSVEVGVVDSNGNLVGSSYIWYPGSYYYNSFDIPRGGSYRVVVISETSNVWTDLRATIAIDVNGSSFANNTWYAVGHSTAAQTRTYKFYPKATGYMRIYSDAKSKITVCNASGKVLAKQVTVNYTPVFGVRADRTYLIKVAWPSGTDGVNRIKIVNGSWWPANGVSKAKATPLSKGKIQKGLVVAGENNVRWFKFTNWQSYVKITLTGGTNDQLVWYIYEGNTLKYRRILTPDLGGMWNSFTAKRGVTYYIKVQKLTSTSSGYYHVKFE